MDVKHLEAFVTTLELGSISSAARQLKKGQPLVSQWLQELESDLGFSLFTRTGNKSTANQNAYDLLPFAQKVLSAHNELSLAARNIEQGKLTQLVMAVDQWVPAKALNTAMARFMISFPDLDIELQTLSRDDVLEGIQSQEIQLGVISELDDLHRKVNFKRIGFYEEVYVASQEWLSKQGNETLSLKQLETQRELILSNSDEEGEEEFDSLQTYLQLSSYELMLSLLKSGAGFAVLPRQTVSNELETGTLIVLSVLHESVALERRVEMVWSLAGENIEEISVLLKCIEEEHGFHR